MDKKVLKRNEVLEKYTWDLTRLFKSESEYLVALDEVIELSAAFNKTYIGSINTVQILLDALTAYQQLLKKLTIVSHYQSLHSSVESNNRINIERQGKFGIVYGDLAKIFTKFNSEITELSDDILEAAIALSPDVSVFLSNVIKDKKHKIAPEIEKALSEFNQVFDAPYSNYLEFKHSDMHFNAFDVNNKEYPLSFSMFENDWSYNANHDIRRTAFEAFYQKLGEYQNGLANNYNTHVLTEKAYANIKGYDSVITFLLDGQDVSLDMYDRQIDLIMEHLAKPMQKYAKLIKDIYGLETMTYADLHLSIDDEFEPKVSIEDANKKVAEALKIYGSEYQTMVDKAFNERWIDYPQNLGKSTGGFCASPYQNGSYILLNWNESMSEAFVLAHELGHAGHFHFAGMNQSILNTRTSLYFIEAPSTMNELIMGDYLMQQSKDLRFKRWVLAQIVSRTYYHNFVTHLLEAAYQRDVYRKVDNKEPISAAVLNELKLNVLKRFWQDAVDIPEYAGLTWMRQPHYFMGLYPYTYSAGLTIATATFNKIKRNELDINKWLDVLKAGGTKKPLELAKMVNLDLSSKQPLLDTIDSIDKMIDEMIAITDELKMQK